MHSSSFLSQINRLLSVCLIVFQVSYHPDGVGEGRDESSSYIITRICGRGCSHHFHFPPVSQPRAPAAELLHLQCCAPRWSLPPASSVRLCPICGSCGTLGWEGECSLPSNFCSLQTLPPGRDGVCDPALGRGH